MDQREFEQYCLLNCDSFICIHEPTLQFIEVSDSCEKITGFSKEELIGKNPYDYYFPADMELVQKNGHLPALDGSQDNSTVYRFRKKDGNYTWLKTMFSPFTDEDGNITTLVSISKAYSDIVQLNNLHEKSEDLYNTALPAAKIGVWEADIEKNSLNWSKAAYDIYELENNSITDFQKTIEFFSGEQKDTVSKAIEKAISKGIPYDITAEITTGKNNKKWIRVIGRPGLQFGKITKLYGIFQDINHQTEEQIQLKSIASKLTNQKRQLEDFNQIVSHNLRSPITNLKILLNLLKTSGSEEEQQLFIDKLSGVANNLTIFLDDLVDVVKVISSRDVEFNLLKMDEIIYKTAKMLEGNIKQIDASIHIQTEEWNEIEYPQIYMESIVLNLFSNALKYYSTERKPYITITTKLENDNKILEIADNGMGIDLNRYGTKVFKLHKTFHRDRPGKGLGLFMTKNQIEAMGGEITVSSEVNKGSTFKINFSKKTNNNIP